MSNASIKKVPPAKIKEWKKQMDTHTISMRELARQCFSNYRTMHNAINLGEAKPNTIAIITNYLNSLK
jgi:hypothetical protein